MLWRFCEALRGSHKTLNTTKDTRTHIYEDKLNPVLFPQSWQVVASSTTTTI